MEAGAERGEDGRREGDADDERARAVADEGHAGPRPRAARVRVRVERVGALAREEGPQLFGEAAAHDAQGAGRVAVVRSRAEDDRVGPEEERVRSQESRRDSATAAYVSRQLQQLSRGLAVVSGR